MNRKYLKEYYLAHKNEILARSAKRYSVKRDEIRQQAMDRYRSDLVGVMIDRSKQRAAKVGVQHTIKRTDIFLPERCPVLGVVLQRATNGKAQANSPSLDRIDPTKGYIPGNVQVMSYKANCMKNNATATELRLFAQYVLSTYGEDQ